MNTVKVQNNANQTKLNKQTQIGLIWWKRFKSDWNKRTQSDKSLTSSAIVLSRLAQSSACSSTAESSVAGPCLKASAAATICCRWRVRTCLKERSRGVAHCHWSREGSSSLRREREMNERKLLYYYLWKCFASHIQRTTILYTFLSSSYWYWRNSPQNFIDL